MNLGLVIFGSLDTLSGGYLYDRKLVDFLRASGDTVEILSLPWRNYAAHLSDNLRFRLPPGLDLVIEDELNHPSLLMANRHRRAPGSDSDVSLLSLVHHLRSSELRPAWQNFLYGLVERSYLKSVDALIFNSATTRGEVQAVAGNAKPHIIAYPPTDRFGSGLSRELVQARAAESAPLRILFLGNVIPRKGLATLLRALVQLDPGQWTLDIVGSLTADPNHAADVERRVMVTGLSSNVRFHGPLDNDALRAKLTHAHVLAVPSSYEGFGIVYLEGMGFGLPAIGTTAGGAAEIITNRVNGYLISPGDAGGLAERLSALARDRTLLGNLSLSALERFRQQPKWEVTATRIRDFLLSVISG